MHARTPRWQLATPVVVPLELKHTTPPPTSATTMTTKPSFAEAVPSTRVAPRRANAMALAIHTVTGQRLVVDDGMRSDTLARLRARISLTHGIAAGTQRLMIDQVTLEEGPQTLAERGIGPESALFLSLQAADHLITESKSAVAAAETAAAEADTAVQGQMEALPQPCSRLMLYRDDGSPKHRRWFHLSRDAEGVASVRWGKNKDGSDHRLWASCGSAPPKSCEVHGVSIEEGPAGSDCGFKILRTGQTGQPLLVAASDGETKEKWVGVLDAVQSHREAVGALEQAREALWQGPAEVARREEEAREAQRFVEVEQLLTTAEWQMGAEEFGAAVVTLRRALTLDGANKEAWAALEQVAFVLDGRIYDVGDDGRLDLAGRKLGREGVTKLARWLATNAGAAMNSLTLDMNGIFGELYPNGNIKNVDTFAGDCDDFFAALKTSNIVTLSLQKTGIGPITLRKLATSLPAALTSINCLANKFGDDDLATLLTAIEGTSVRSLCGFTEGQTVADFSRQNLGPIDIKIMAAEYGFRGFIATLTSLNCENNLAMVGELESYGYYLKTSDVHAGIFNQLTDVLKTSQVTEVNFFACGIGPVALGHLNEWVREATAAVARLILDENPLTGGGSCSTHFDTDITGITDLCDTLKTSSVTELGLAKCRLGPGSLCKLAKYVREADMYAEAAVARLILDENPLTGGNPWDVDKDITGVTSLFDTLKTSSVTELGLAKCRLGPGSLGKLAEYVRDADAAIAYLALGSNRIGDEAMISLLDVLKDIPLISLDISNTNCGVCIATKLAELLSEETKFRAAVTSVNCLANKFGEADLATLLTAIEGTSVRSLCGLTEGQTIADFSRQNLGPIDCKIIAAEYGFRGFIAAVAQLILDENPLTGGTRSSHFDKDITGVVNLCDTLKTSSVTELSLAKCRLGPGSLGKLAEYVRDATAAVLTKIDIRGAYIGEEVFAGLKGVAPEGCEVFWSEGDEGRVH
eukprot:COSAG02_NODE_67_length_42609_cov_14.506681_8_plen_981_part_00